ncbi:hypothetical protein [Oscillibacter sp.]|uniref:putative ABC transporter permease n=1 Tax=Oscillibacter sp. TaxID=1945593 RepID=UPI00262ABF5B|nr:hypothetical protein [Oscillibacter sp.]MDD3346379.1 hypothetical protein [Oscillibacter sp.]
MHVYTTGQWVLLFFFYCLCGWVWESCYVSLCQRRWVNRGFLNGPLLPIYGSGAILILFATLPVENKLPLVWLFGMLAATALEYVTGAAMEKLFQVRYWDYSKHRFNLNGHICLSSSIAWGFFSILLVRCIHPPIARLLLRFPSFLVDPTALLATAAFTVDAVRSFQAAMDLREVLTKLTEENEDLRRLAKRAEVVSAFAEEDLRRFRAKTELDAALLKQRVESGLREEQALRTARKNRRMAVEEFRLQNRANAKLEILDAISEALERAKDRLESAADLTEDRLAERRADLCEALERVRDRRSAIRSRSNGAYRRSLRLLRANPSAMAKGFEEALDALRSLSDTADRK